MSAPVHTITKALVQGARIATLRARCSCGDFESNVQRLSTPGRRKQDRLIREHLGSVAAVPDVAALLADNAIEAPL